MLGFLIGEALRDLRRAGRVAISAILLITLSLAALGGFWLVSSNIGQATDHWRNYERWLDPLKASLGPVLEAYPEPPGRR